MGACLPSITRLPQRRGPLLVAPTAVLEPLHLLGFGLEWCGRCTSDVLQARVQRLDREGRLWLLPLAVTSSTSELLRRGVSLIVWLDEEYPAVVLPEDLERRLLL